MQSMFMSQNTALDVLGSFATPLNCSVAPRRTFHVCKSTDGIYEYLRNRYKTYYVDNMILRALAKAQDFDQILIYPGTYAEIAALTITQKSLRIGAAFTGKSRGLSETYIQEYGLGLDAIICNASNVEIAGIGFVNAAGKSGVVVANGAGTGGVYIHDCYFYDVAQTGDYHVINGTSSYNAVGTMIEDCHFFKGKNGILMRGNRSTVRNCHFDVMSSCYGIYHHADARWGMVAKNNTFQAQGTSSAQYGIYFNAQPGAGAVHMSGNHFANFANDDYCINVPNVTLGPYCGLNYNGVTAIALT